MQFKPVGKVKVSWSGLDLGFCEATMVNVHEDAAGDVYFPAIEADAIGDRCCVALANLAASWKGR